MKIFSIIVAFLENVNFIKFQKSLVLMLIFDPKKIYLILYPFPDNLTTHITGHGAGPHSHHVMRQQNFGVSGLGGGGVDRGSLAGGLSDGSRHSGGAGSQAAASSSVTLPRITSNKSASTLPHQPPPASAERLPSCLKHRKSTHASLR